MAVKTERESLVNKPSKLSRMLDCQGKNNCKTFVLGASSAIHAVINECKLGWCRYNEPSIATQFSDHCIRFTSTDTAGINTHRITAMWHLILSNSSYQLGYWHQRADERHGNPPRDNQELLVVRDKVGRPPGELGVSKSMEWDISPSVFWHCWLGDRKGIRPVKKLDVGLLVVLIWLELCTTYSSSWERDRERERERESPVVTTTSIIIRFSKHRLTQVHVENGR